MLNNSRTIEAEEISARENAVIFDCRFSLADSGAGEALYRQGHIPGAHYLHLERHMSSSVLQHGGRHPLPEPAGFIALLALYGVGSETEVIAYDDNRLAYAARLWWLMKSLGFRPPALLSGGYQAWLDAGGKAETAIPAANADASVAQGIESVSYSGHCDIEGLRAAQDRGSTLVDSREEKRYLGLEESIDPVAGHIPGALNHPWRGVTDSAGKFLPEEVQRAHWGEVLQADELVVYCGSGVTACVNLFSLASLGRDDAILYGGSWSDWCSYL
jgi:thiosulfate/3-mercaptopyruvate sulfurtransferase